MKSEREDYIKTIYKLTERYGQASHKQICEMLGISGASVSQMLKKLKEANFVKTDGKAILLTQSGEKIAKKILSRHRLWETFLHDYLGMPWHKIHKHAELLEHATDDELTDKLNQFLGNPDYDPHGGVIYDNVKTQRNTIPLGQIEPNQTVTVARVYDDNSGLLEHLENKQIDIGDTIIIVERSDILLISF